MNQIWCKSFALLVAATVCPAWARAQAATGVSPDLSSSLAASSIRMIASMALVLAVLGACAWALRRWRDGQNTGSNAIEIVSGVTLGSKERVVLLRVGDEQVLVGVSPAGMRSLHVVKDKPSARPFDLAMGASE